MAATEDKAPQTAAFDDVAFSVGAGDTVFIFTDDAGGLKGNEFVAFYLDTPDNDLLAFTLSGQKPAQAISGACDLIAKKYATSVKIGVAHFAAA